MKTGLDALIGMGREKARARIDIAACAKTKEAFPHTLLEGCGGTGKTAFALAIAHELRYHSVVVEAAAMKNRGEIIEKLISSQREADASNKKLLFFIDEVHRLSISLQEVLYYPMDRKSPRITTAGGDIQFKPFTLFAATTRKDTLDQASFVNRFVNVWRVDRYSLGDICAIIKNYFLSQKINISLECSIYIAKRCLGVPRRAIRLSEKVRNVFYASGNKCLDLSHCKRAIFLEGLDEIGLDELSISYMRILSESDCPRGLGSIAGRLGQQNDVIEGTVEPLLMELSFIDRTGKGRVLAPKGKAHLQNFHSRT